MVRRVTALVGISLILAVVVALVWTVHTHQQKTVLPSDTTDVISLHLSPTPEEVV